MSSSTVLRPSRSPMTDDELFYSLSRELKPSTPHRVGKAPNASSFLVRAGSAGLEVLDTLGSSLAELLSSSTSGFVSSSGLRGFKVSIFAFEVANTIVKGSNLMQSLTEEHIQILKKHILLLEGVQLLGSADIKELLRIAAADKRQEFEIFSREVVRFGDMCKDLQWHNLDRVFRRFDLERVTNKRIREEAESTMQELVNLAQHTAELYHEYHALDRFEQVYRRKCEEVKSLRLPQKGESLMILQSELKLQRKLVKNLIRKSLWSKSLEEIVEKLVDIVIFINQEIAEAFDENAAILTNDDESDKKTERLGVSGLALHYANLITQIDNIASRPTSLHPNMRDTLYNSLPAIVKAGLRSRVQALDPIEVMTVPQIKEEMEKTLQWLVPIATDTIKAHQSFGWIGEWANTGFEFRKNTLGSNNIIRLQTLYHADKHKMDQYILDLIILLHRLINLTNGQLQLIKISQEDINLLEGVTNRRTLVPGVSKSQDFTLASKKKRAEVFASSRSMGVHPE